MTEPSFDGVWAKFNRSAEHLQALEQEVAAALEENEYEARGELNADQTEYILTAHAAAELDLVRAGIVFGDAIQNLRVSLDHLLCQLVIASGAAVTRSHAFPIFRSEPQDDRSKGRWKRMTAGIASDYLSEIRRLQPYLADNPEESPLQVLADLSNADKHRVILPLAIAVGSKVAETLKPIPHDLEVTGPARIKLDLPLDEGTEVMRVPVRVTGPAPHMEIQGTIPVGMAFGEPRYTAEGVEIIRQHVGGVVRHFQGLVFRS